MGVTGATISRWVAAGMPCDSEANARAWLDLNPRREGRPRGYSPIRARLEKAATNGHESKEHTGNGHAAPQAAATAAPASPGLQFDMGPAPTAELLLARLEQVERLAFAMLADARQKGEGVLERECVRIHRDAVGNLMSARGEWLALQEKERTMVSGQWVREIIARHDGVLVNLVRSMPRALASRIAPQDPDHAEAELRRWVNDTFLATLYSTNPFERGATGDPGIPAEPVPAGA
jgi:hypothetical protein